MKALLLFWATPIAFLGAWYGLSYHDISFGIFMLTRQAHDLVFQVYGDLLGLAPQAIPPLVARAILIDSLILFAIVAFRRRQKIRDWWLSRQSATAAGGKSRSSIDNLSSAP